MLKSINSLILLLGLAVLPSTRTNAAIIPDADINLQGLTLQYSVTEFGGDFDATGTSSAWTLSYKGGPSYFVKGGGFDFAVSINESKQIVCSSENSFTLIGELRNKKNIKEAIPSAVLLTGTTTQFVDNGGTLTFVLSISDGTLKNNFGGYVTLNFNQLNDTWEVSGIGYSPVQSTIDLMSEPVPEPTSLAIWATMGIGALVIRRRIRPG